MQRFAMLVCNLRHLEENIFTKSGFRLWKHALDARGFPRHEKSGHHLQAMALWQEKMHRTDTFQSISTLVNSNALEKKSLLY